MEPGPRSSQEVARVEVTSTPEVKQDELEEKRNRMEDEVRRQEVKRKTAPGGRKPKRRKLERLVGRGEPQAEPNNNLETTSEIGLGLGVGNMPIISSLTNKTDMAFGLAIRNGVGTSEQTQGLDWMTGVEQRLDSEIRKQIVEPSRAKIKISEKVRKTKFKFNKRGKLKEKEMIELTRTHKNIFDWVKVVPSILVADKEIEDDGQDTWLREVMEKEERLVRMESRKKAWEAEYICKDVLEGIMIAVSRSGNERKVRNILEMVVDTAIQESRVRDILTDIKEYRLESIIMEAMRKEERLKKMLKRQRVWETKYICKEILEEVLGAVKSESEEIALDTMLNDVANMMEREEMEFDDMDWSQEYDWTQGEGLADILARMEISASMMDTTEQELTMCMMGDRMGKGEEDMDMEDGDAKEARETDDDIFKDECIKSVHCEGNCAKDGCGVGKDEHLELDECIQTVQCPGGCSLAGGHTAEVNRSPGTQESGMPKGNYSLMEPQPGQVGWTDDSLEVAASKEEEGHGGDLHQEGDGRVHGEPQQEGDAQAQGGVRVPRVVVSGLLIEQQRQGQEFDKLDISKLISTWDVMAASAFSEQPGGGKGGEGGSGVRRRRSAEFNLKLNRFEELKFDGGVGKKQEKLLVVRAPEETKPNCLYENFTDICSKLPGTSPGAKFRKKQYIQQKLCVSRKTANVRGGMLLVER